MRDHLRELDILFYAHDKKDLYAIQITSKD